MDDNRLKALYRQHTAGARTLDADALHDALGRHGYPDVEDTPLDRIAASSLQSDVMRLVMELGPDAQQFSRDVAAARRPRAVVPMFVRRTLSLAAGIGAVAVVFTMLHGGQPGGSVIPTDAHEARGSIMSGSFEPGMQSHQDRIEIQEAAPIFKGDFDS